MKTVVLPIPIHGIFEDAAKSFAANPCDDTLCFGVQDWTLEQIKEQRCLAKGKLIAYQSELLYAGNMPFRNGEYAEKLKLFDEIWDYSEHNVNFLQQHRVTTVKYKPLLPSEALRDIPLEKDIDIFHFGSWSRHRTEYLNAAIAEGFNVYDLLFEHKKMLYGEKLHQLIRKSKVVLGLHSYPQSPQQECFRYQYPLSNDIKVLAEKSLSNPLNIDEFTDIGEMVEKLRQTVPPEPITHDAILDRFIFAQYASYLEEAEKNCLSDEWSDRLSYAVSYMNSDLDVANEMKHFGKRGDDVKTIEFKVFDDLLRISLALMRNRKGLDKRDFSSISQGSKRAYRGLQKTSVKKALLSTGGNLMPRLRCMLLLHGWSLMNLSLKTAVVFHKDKKFIRYISNPARL